MCPLDFGGGDMTEVEMPDGAGWFEKHVVQSLAEIRTDVRELRSAVTIGEKEVEGRLSKVEERVLLWGAVAVFIVSPVVAALVAKVLK